MDAGAKKRLFTTMASIVNISYKCLKKRYIVNKMFYLFFFSGLALFSLGLVVALEILRPVPQEVKTPFAYLAGFGFLQAIHQWLELRDFILFPAHTWPLLTADISLFLISVLSLLIFSLCLITKNKFVLYLLPLFLLLWFAAFWGQMSQLLNNENIHLLAIAYGRLFIYLPANLIAAYAFLYGRAVKTLNNPLLTTDRRALAVLFLLNSFFNGLVAKANRFLFYGLSDQAVDTFFGFSIEVFRATIITIITIFFLHSLRIFEHLFSQEMRTKQILERESLLAGQIQSQLIPKEPLIFSNVFICGAQMQAYQAGGDIYSYLPVNTDVSLFVGDVSGKGVSSAVLAALAVIILETETKACKDTALVCLRADQLLKEKLPSNYFLTLIQGFYHPHSREINICSCGHPLPFHYKIKEQKWLAPLEASSLPVGLSFAYQPFKMQIKLESGDKLLFYTDGFTDVANPAGVRLETKGVLEWLQQHKQLTASHLVKEIMTFTKKYSDGHLKDDVTVLVLEVKE